MKEKFSEVIKERRDRRNKLKKKKVKTLREGYLSYKREEAKNIEELGYEGKK